MEEIPTSRIVRWIYAARLRHALNHKLIALSFPGVLLVLGLGAWIGLPKVLRPLEKTAAFFGAELNNLPGYVDAKHSLIGLRSDDWIALDEGSWFYMPSLYPAASFSQAMQVLQTQDALIAQIPEVKDVLGKIGRVAVLPEMRGRGIGKDLVLFAVDELRRRGASRAMLGAQTHALGFYEALGFSGFGPEFMDAGILHREMVREL